MNLQIKNLEVANLILGVTCSHPPHWMKLKPMVYSPFLNFLYLLFIYIERKNIIINFKQKNNYKNYLIFFL